MIMYEEDKFFIVDTGSSNGSFVNNIRLSKSGEESKLTRIYTNDILRFGSDVVDKVKFGIMRKPNGLTLASTLQARQVTQKCVVAKLRLVHPDGGEELSRPSDSRLFRPNDSTEDLSALTQTLQDALTREKMLEDKLINIRSMISKNIGKTHTDLLRLFENMKQEIMNDQASVKSNFELEAYQTVSIIIVMNYS